ASNKKFEINDYVRIQYCGIENEALMLYGAYQIASIQEDYGLRIGNTIYHFNENQLRAAYKYEILEAKICQSANA
ncbi:MAG: hypothetical protein DRQ01_04580, partial [Ignavibacteriae bacterium]